MGDVARRASVSTSTVSHVLNGTRHVRPETEERVRKAATELGYRPNLLARSLRQQKTHTIGLLVSDIENPYFSELAWAVEARAYERGYSVILCNTDELLVKERLYVELLFAKQVDGLILAPAPGEHAFLRPYLRDGARLVLVNRQLPDVEAPYVVTDDEEALRTLTQRLLSDGHRRIGAVIGLPEVSTTRHRMRGVSLALEDWGLSLADLWLHEGGARWDGGYRAAYVFADLTEPPTAIIAFNSLMLDGFLIGLMEHAPACLASTTVTGIGHSLGHSLVVRTCPACRYYLAQPGREVGRVATDVLLDSLEDGEPWEPRGIVVEHTLVEMNAEALVV